MGRPKKPAMTKAEIHAYVVARSEESADGCRNWVCCVKSRGTPRCRIAVDGEGHKEYSVPRLLYETYRKPVDKESVVIHTCGNAACVRLTHLLCVKKDDLVGKLKELGLYHGQVLTYGDVKRIKALKGQQSTAQLAETYGVSTSQINRIYQGRRWADAA